MWIFQCFITIIPLSKDNINRFVNRDYINYIMSDFIEIHGDRLFSDDKAIVSGLAKIDKEIRVRYARAGELLVLLDGKTVNLNQQN